MAQIRRIGLFFPSDSPFYQGLFVSLQRAFSQLGVTVRGGLALPGEEELERFVGDFTPDAILEMNRSRKQVPFLPGKIKHIAWMVDVADWPYDLIDESELIYFFGHNWLRNYPNPGGHLVGWFPPGTDPSGYYPEQKNMRCRFMFAGHIPAPWNKNERERILYRKGNRVLRFDRLFSACQKHWQEISTRGFDNAAYLDSAERLASSMVNDTVSIRGQKLRYDISCRSVRVINRVRMMEAVCATAQALHIYGSPTWRQYPQFHAFYRHYLASVDELRDAYNSSYFTLHEGVGLHFRTFDCLASGGLLFYRTGPDDADPGGMQTFFEPHVHYVPFTEDNIGEQMQRYINMKKSVLDRMKERTVRYINQKHTWRHRACQLLNDLSQC